MMKLGIHMCITTNTLIHIIESVAIPDLASGRPYIVASEREDLRDAKSGIATLSTNNLFSAVIVGKPFQTSSHGSW